MLTVSFAKIQWQVAGTLSLSDVLTAFFLFGFAINRLERFDGRFARCTAVTFGFFLAFLLVYLIGFFNLDTNEALDQWVKGLVKWLLHFGFLVASVALVARRSERFYWVTLATFCGGIALNAVYGLLQLGVAQATGGNLDAECCPRSRVERARSTSTAPFRGRACTGRTRSPSRASVGILIRNCFPAYKALTSLSLLKSSERHST